MKRHSTQTFFSILLTTLALGPVSSFAGVLKPEDLVGLIRKNNGSARAGELNAQAASARTGYLMRSFFPSLSLDAGGETFQTGTYSVKTEPYGAAEVRLNLFRSGRDLLEDRMRSAQFSSAKAQKDQVEAAQLLEARRIYWRLVSRLELIALYQESIQDNEKSLKSALRRISRGVTTDTDRLEFEMHGDELSEDFESLKHKSIIDQLKLKALLGLPDDASVQTIDSLSHEHDDGILKEALSPAHPSLVRSEAAQQEADSAASFAGRSWAPSLDVYGGYYLFTLRDRDYLNLSDRKEYAFGLRLSMSLWDGGQSRSQAQAKRFQADAFQAELTQERRSIAANVQALQEEMKHAHELIHKLELRVKQGAAYVTRTASEYDRGVKNSPDMLGSLQRQIGFKKRLVELKLDYQLSKAELLQHFGK